METETTISRTMRITVWDPNRQVNHLINIIRDRKLITEFTRLISSTRIDQPVLMMDVKAKTVVDGLIKRISPMLDEIE